MLIAKRPQGPVDVVLDTDTYNEIDDQFALAYLLRKPGQLRLKAIFAAPFLNHRSASPKDGMEKSFLEIQKLLQLMELSELENIVYRGSADYLSDEESPVDSPAARRLCSLAMEYSPENPLYVVAIGAITNIASALLMKPEIKENIVLVWLGGNSHDWHDNMEFNLYQDVAAARIVFGCGVPMVQLPCMGVVSAFTTTGPELIHHLKGRNKLCDYLVEYSCQQAVSDGGNSCWSRAIWDVSAVGWLLDSRFMLDRLEPSPIPEYSNRYSFDKRRHQIRYVYHINRDALMKDLFNSLGAV